MARIEFHRNLDWGSEKPAADKAPSGEEKRISYDPLEHGPLAAFDRSPQGAALRAQYRENIGKLSEFLRNRDPVNQRAVRSLEAFDGKIAQGADGPYSTALHALYGPGKHALDNVAARIDEGGHSGEALEAGIVELANGLDVCAPGVASHLIMTDQTINAGQDGIDGHAKMIWETLFDSVLRDFVAHVHGAEENYQGEEIHLVNQYRNLLAPDFHVAPRPDDFKPPQAGANGLLEGCRRYLQRHVTPDRLLRVMAEECLQTVREHFAAYQDRPLDTNEVWALRQAYDKSLGASLAMKYGEIDAGVLVNEHNGEQVQPDNNEDSHYWLIDNPTLLMRAISKNLYTAAIIGESYKPVRLFGQKGEDGVVKQVGGGGIYTKTGHAYRPLRVDEWGELAGRSPEADQNGTVMAVLLRTALANTRSPELLAKVPPERVWHAIAQGIDSVNALTRLAQPEIRRYRQVSKDHDTFLVNEAARAVGERSPSERQRALLIVSAGGESALGVRIAETLDTVSGKDAAGRSALHHAVLNGDMQLLDVLIPKSALFIDVPDRNGLAPLMAAARNGDTEAIDRLIGAGAIVDNENEAGIVALMVAAQHNRADVIDRLLEKGASIDIDNRAGFTALMTAAQYGSVAAIDQLVAAGAAIDITDLKGHTALMVAADYGRADAIDRLLSANPEVDKTNHDGYTALMLAAQNGRVEAIDRLLTKARPEIDKTLAKGFTALILAAQNGHDKAIERLLNANPEVDKTNEYGFTALMLAAQKGHDKAVGQLLNARPEIDKTNPEGFTALMLAAYHGRDTVIEQLLTKARPEIDKTDPKGFTALMLAAFHGRDKAIEQLLNAHPNVDKTDPKGYTALMLAARNGHDKAVGQLLNAKPEIDKTNPKGFTALMLAAHQGQDKAIDQLLTKAKPEIDKENTKGHTALMLAAASGAIHVVDRLLDNGAKVDKRDKNGVTAIQFAQRGGFSAVVDRLKSV
ncbi:ankyrin repeat domain-containing protein [Burkholderia stabilis]|uniref:ankyrin repeat domain-containing protein n=1 Tax=Burkholderia stabilis TaxID=95485 RepID=UPI00158C2B5B|nr:ankyrin repeat domain-containing protein [Burkholderia stabilis]